MAGEAELQAVALKFAQIVTGAEVSAVTPNPANKTFDIQLTKGGTSAVLRLPYEPAITFMLEAN